MTEDDWLACTDPKPMLRFLIGDYPRVQDVEAFPDCKASDRKLRLFACACYYRVRRLLRSPLARATVEVAERFADGLSTLQELQEADARLWRTVDALEGRWRASDGAERETLAPIYEARALALQCSRPEAPKAAWYASSNAYLTVAMIENPDGVGGWDRGFSRSQRTEERTQADVLRCLLDRLPFRPVESVAPGVLRWNDGVVVKLARAAYENRQLPEGTLDQDRLNILADALDDASCADADLLTHLRSGGEHYRGCYAVDVILDRS